jgi:hypothetical protein
VLPFATSPGLIVETDGARAGINLDSDAMLLLASEALHEASARRAPAACHTVEGNEQNSTVYFAVPRTDAYSDVPRLKHLPQSAASAYFHGLFDDDAPRDSSMRGLKPSE